MSRHSLCLTHSRRASIGAGRCHCSLGSVGCGCSLLGALMAEASQHSTAARHNHTNSDGWREAVGSRVGDPQWHVAVSVAGSRCGPRGAVRTVTRCRPTALPLLRPPAQPAVFPPCATPWADRWTAHWAVHTGLVQSLRCASLCCADCARPTVSVCHPHATQNSSHFQQPCASPSPSPLPSL